MLTREAKSLVVNMLDDGIMIDDGVDEELELILFGLEYYEHALEGVDTINIARAAYNWLPSPSSEESCSSTRQWIFVSFCRVNFLSAISIIAFFR